MRVAFAGAAHSHPFSDARNLRERGAEVAGVWEADDPVAAAAFGQEFEAPVVRDLDALLDDQLDLVIVTPRTHRVAGVVHSLVRAGVPFFVNKVAAATSGQLDSLDQAMPASRGFTSSVLRFAPRLTAFAAQLEGEQVLAARVRAQHDLAGFTTPARAWQDDPAGAGGTLVNIGVHAWEMLDVLLDDDVTVDAGSTRRRPGSPTRSEDVAIVHGRTSGGVPLTAEISGLPGPDSYALSVMTGSGLLELELAVDDLVTDLVTELGYRELASRLVDFAAGGDVPVPWRRSRRVLASTIHAAELARSAAT